MKRCCCQQREIPAHSLTQLSAQQLLHAGAMSQALAPAQELLQISLA